MSREIKFRGLTANGEWVFGLPANDALNSTAYYSEYSQRICWLPESGGYANAPIKNGTLCQFTGLLDKNGKEIYEGDILRTESEKIYLMSGDKTGKVAITLSVVIWKLDGWGYRHVANVQESCCAVGFETKGLAIKAQYSEVIGNIHENPELLAVQP